jgi:hypothetical protein
LRLPENNNPATKTQANKPVETSLFLWESDDSGATRVLGDSQKSPPLK